MDTDNQHQMVIVHQHEDGSQEWHCPTCGRRFIMQWPPNYHRTILEPGDETAVHTGGMKPVEMKQVEPESSTFIEPESAEEAFDPSSLMDPYLAPFERFIQDLDLS